MSKMAVRFVAVLVAFVGVSATTSIGYAASLGGHGMLKGDEQDQTTIHIPAQDGDDLIITVDYVPDASQGSIYANNSEFSVFAWPAGNDSVRNQALLMNRSLRELHFHVSGNRGVTLQIKNDGPFDAGFNWNVEGITELVTPEPVPTLPNSGLPKPPKSGF